ncbi:MAG: hypothetical protein IPH65_14700 [Dehalococcoidia bacterium]|uniref:hypothetical protein n=1 Tax=Candidatus Amarobacter glycogenicus TaxID=3140699 RepID=UPI003136CC9B|nr:hypothetical protein [Dehalococcoidia bacterium]
MRRFSLPVILLLISCLATLPALACGGDGGGDSLTVITHDSFNLSEELIKQFRSRTT